MAKHLSERGRALAAANPDLADLLDSISEARRGTAAMQSGEADSISHTYEALMDLEREEAFYLSRMAAAGHAPDPAVLADNKRRKERKEREHQNAQESARAATTISVARRNTDENCIGLVNQIALLPTPPSRKYPPLPKGDPAKTRDAARADRLGAIAELRAVETAAPTEAEDMAEVEATIGALEKQGLADPQLVWVGNHAQVRFSLARINAEPDSPGGFAVQTDAIPLLVSLFPDVIRRRAFQQVRDFHAKTKDVLRLTREDKARRARILRERIDTAERLEAACIIALAGDAPAIHFPPDLGPVAILGLHGVAWQRQ